MVCSQSPVPTLAVVFAIILYGYCVRPTKLPDQWELADLARVKCYFGKNK